MSSSSRKLPSVPGVSDVRGRLDVRRRAQRRRRILLVGLLLVALVLAGVGTWIVGYSHVVDVRHEDVRGGRLLTGLRITQAAQVPHGVPLAQLDTQAIADRVAALREVDRVRVTKSWPHTVRIVVTERTPVYALRYAGAHYLVDAKGVMYSSVPAAPDGLVEATASSTDLRLLSDLATAVSAFSGPIKTATLRVRATSPDAIVLTLRKGGTALWGSAENSDQKAAALTALLSSSTTRNARAFDVSSPGNPATR